MGSGISEVSHWCGNDSQEGASREMQPSMYDLFSERNRLQRYLDVEATLALEQGDLGIIPAKAARAIANCAQIDMLDGVRIANGRSATGHTLMPLISELARVVGEPHGGWVHWGATTQNIQQTADVLALRSALDVIERRVCNILLALADLGERSASMMVAGRTHWQHAVPITFGFKVAGWTDTTMRHLDRLEQLRPRLLTCMLGGAVGNFASLGPIGPVLQAGVARRLGLSPMKVPMRNIVDPLAELVLTMGMIAGTSGSIAEEITRLMSTELGEVAEELPVGDIGSSTMPQKRNAKQAGHVIIKGAEIRALAPLALEAMIQAYEVDGTRSSMIRHATEQCCILGDEMLVALASLIGHLRLFPERMRHNLALTQGLINAERVMLELGKSMGRLEAHGVVQEAATKFTASDEFDFAQAIASDPRAQGKIKIEALRDMLNPATYSGLSEELSLETATLARIKAQKFLSSPPLQNVIPAFRDHA
jgi:3-carboxy-cis,cis-muconate cycloisomerase